ncbi:MAG TPA: glycosyltransferase family 4 protein [Pyrinomonadaceae bacterium]|nr:glycosyltransferase family 4 protein [Pyrinomonadaceae bacterium]
MMARIAILSPSVSSGDAVGNDVLGMFGALKRRGAEVQVYAESGSLDGIEVRRASRLENFLKSSDDLLIYHFSMGWLPGLELTRKLGCRIAVRYHNVTPPEFFAGLSASHEQMGRTGREQLKQIARANHSLYLSASEYNMRELVEAGAEASKNFVLPPFHHVDLLDSVSPDSRILEAYNDGRTNILMVGRLVPHKGHASLIEAFANYYYNYNSNSRLLIVGKQDEAFRGYYETLKRLVSRLRLEQSVIFTGGVTDEELKAYYMIAHLFMITSKHEGFCVPIVEAMAMKLPVLAYASSAIPGTVGDAGIVWDERNPLLMAEAVDCLMRDEALRAELGEKGLKRYRSFFTNQKIEDEFIRVLGRLR